jgi:hypothetical protein
VSYDSIPDCLATTRPSRSSRRAAQLGIDQGPNKLAVPAPVQQQGGQVGIRFGRTTTHVGMLISINGQSAAIPMTPDEWDNLAAQGDEQADLIRDAVPLPVEAEPVVEYSGDEQAEKGHSSIEQAVSNYGRAVVSKPMMAALFRHAEHARNWARKHHLDLELDLSSGAVTFSPAPVDPYPPLIIPEGY